MNEQDLKIPEIEEPKNSQVGFKVSESDKDLITEFCEERNYRISAFCRVAVLTHMKNILRKEKENGER